MTSLMHQSIDYCKWAKVNVRLKFVNSLQDMRDWCWRHKSNGRFYYNYQTNTFYFEEPLDATYFALVFEH